MKTEQELYLLSIQDKIYEIKLAVSIFFVISHNIRINLYPLIANIIGDTRKRFFFSKYPNDIEQQKILTALYKLYFCITVNDIYNYFGDKRAIQINEPLLDFLNNALSIERNDIFEMEKILENKENYLQKVAFQICDIIDYRDPFLALRIVALLSDWFVSLFPHINKSLIPCKEEDLIPIVYALNNWE